MRHQRKLRVVTDLQVWVLEVLEHQNLLVLAAEGTRGVLVDSDWVRIKGAS